jgi:hypothetical protein
VPGSLPDAVPDAVPDTSKFLPPRWRDRLQIQPRFLQ